MLILGNKYPLRLFGIVENEEEIEFIPFLVCYYSESDVKLNQEKVYQERVRRDARRNEKETRKYDLEIM